MVEIDDSKLAALYLIENRAERVIEEIARNRKEQTHEKERLGPSDKFWGFLGDLRLAILAYHEIPEAKKQDLRCGHVNCSEPAIYKVLTKNGVHWDACAGHILHAMGNAGVEKESVVVHRI